MTGKKIDLNAGLRHRMAQAIPSRWWRLWSKKPYVDRVFLAASRSQSRIPPARQNALSKLRFARCRIVRRDRKRSFQNARTQAGLGHEGETTAGWQSASRALLRALFPALRLVGRVRRVEAFHDFVGDVALVLTVPAGDVENFLIPGIGI